jgi:cell division protein FtsQ
VSAPTRPRRPAVGPGSGRPAREPADRGREPQAATVSRTSARRFAARARARRLLSLRPILVLLAVVALAAGAGWVLLRSSWLAVDEVVVVGAAAHVSGERVLETADVTVGTPLLRVDTEAVASRVAAIPEIASVEVTRSWPHGIEVAVTERSPVAVVSAGTAFRYVDADGVIFGAVERRPRGVPLVEAEADVVAPETLRAALSALAAIPPAVERRVTSVSARTPDDVVLKLTKGQRVAWGGAERPERKASVLLAIMRAQRGVAVYDVSAPDVPTTRGVAGETG